MIGARAKKIAGDLTTRWGRTLLTVAGLAFGLFGAGAVVVALVILKDDLNGNFRHTNPPNITVEAGLISPELQTRLAALPQVSGLETRPTLGGRLEGAPGRWNPISIFVVEDFQRLGVAKFCTDKGAFPPARGSMLVERDGMFFVWRTMGKALNLRLADGKLVAPVFAGTAFDPGQAPSRMEQSVLGYVSRETAADWGFQPLSSRLLITVRGADRRTGSTVGRQIVRPVSLNGCLFEGRCGRGRPQDAEHLEAFALHGIVVDPELDEVVEEGLAQSFYFAKILILVRAGG